MEKIREAFAKYFRDFDLQLPEAVPAKGTIEKAGWQVRFILDKDEQGQDRLEFYASHRMTNARHERILSNGELESLDAEQDMFSFDPKKPGDREAAEARMKEHNEKVLKELTEKGLWP